jgi:hypothetical protein
LLQCVQTTDRPDHRYLGAVTFAVPASPHRLPDLPI